MALSMTNQLDESAVGPCKRRVVMGTHEGRIMLVSVLCLLLLLVWLMLLFLEDDDAVVDISAAKQGRVSCLLVLVAVAT